MRDFDTIQRMDEDSHTINKEKKQTAPLPAARAEGEDGARLPRIRTYAADMSRVIKQRGETLSSIITAERGNIQKGAETDDTKNERRKTLLLGGGTVLLALLGVGAVVGVFLFVSSKNEPPQFSESIIFPNRIISVPVEENISEELAQIRAETDMSLGDIARIVLTKNGAQLSPQETARQLGVSGELSREVADIMVGIHAFDRNQPFVIMQVGAFDRSFSALLAEEKELGRDLGSFFAPRNAPDSGAPSLAFNDAVIRNIDVRKSGDMWPILYAYPTRTTIVLTTNEFTLRETVSRLGNQGR